MSTRRPTREAAETAITSWLDKHAPGYPTFHFCEDGDDSAAEGKCGLAFWVAPQDTTSYLHEDLSVEWYGTGWNEDPELSAYEYDENTGDFIERTLDLEALERRIEGVPSNAGVTGA